MPGTIELLSAVQDMRDHNGDAPALALVSDFPNDEPVEEYFALLRTLGIDTFFTPLKQRVTLSSEVGVVKPDEKIFQAAINKISRDLSYQNVIFITENREHTAAARKLGMMTIRLKRAGKKPKSELSLKEIILKGNEHYYKDEYKEAIECYDKALEIDYDNFDLWFNKGYSLSALGKDQEAIECYDKA